MNKKGSQVLVIDDDGYVYATSTKYMLGLLSGSTKYDFILMSRLPWKASSERFKPSPLYDPTGIIAKQNEPTVLPKPDITGKNDVGVGGDVFSNKFKTTTQQKKAFTDKMVWDDD